jgi:hypothetical protein
MSIFIGQLIQGEANILTLTAYSAAFQGTETLTASLSTGGTAAAVLTITPTWTTGQTTGEYSRFDAAFTAVQTAALTPGYYVLQAGISDASAALAWGLIEVVAAAGQLPAYDWLVQPAEVLGLVSDLVTVDNLADLPRILTAATEAIRRYCHRNFTRATRTKEFRPSYEGVIRLDEIPVNQVTRVAIGRDNALRIIGPSSAQIARVQFAFVGDYAAGIVNTGVTLASVANATTTTTTLNFATYATLSALATAIQGAGWTCSVTPGYSAWPCSELIGGDAAQGALTGDGAWLDVYSEDATLERLDPETGMITLRSRYGSTSWDSPAWGPDRGGFSDARPFPSRAKVTYDAGFDAIPSPVVQATVEVVQAAFARLKSDNAIKSERAADYSYVYRDIMEGLPVAVRQLLAPYRIYNA